MALVWGSTLRDRTQIDVLNYLANCGNDEGGNCFPGIPRIARFVRCSERTVIRTITVLERLGFIRVFRGDGRGNFTEFLINVDKLKECQDVTLSGARKRMTTTTKKGDTVPRKGDSEDKPLKPLNGRTINDPSENRDARERALTRSATANGEFLAARWLLDELGLAAGSYDVRMLGQVIAYAARDAPCEVQQAAKMLLEAGKDALGRGETVNVFWFKDRKFAGSNDGASKANGNTARVTRNRRAVADWLAKRGVDGPWSSPRADDAPMAGSGVGAVDRGVRDGSGATRDSRGPTESDRSGRGSAPFVEILSPSG